METTEEQKHHGQSFQAVSQERVPGKVQNSQNVPELKEQQNPKVRMMKEKKGGWYRKEQTIHAFQLWLAMNCKLQICGLLTFTQKRLQDWSSWTSNASSSTARRDALTDSAQEQTLIFTDCTWFSFKSTEICPVLQTLLKMEQLYSAHCQILVSLLQSHLVRLISDAFGRKTGYRCFVEASCVIGVKGLMFQNSSWSYSCGVWRISLRVFLVWLVIKAASLGMRWAKLIELNENISDLRLAFIRSLTWGSFLRLGATLVRQSDDFSTQTMSR